MKKYLAYDVYFEFLLYVATIGYIVYGGVAGKYGYIANGILTLIVIVAPRIIMKIFKFKVTTFISFLVQFFIFVSMFLGRLNGFYGRVPHWDTFLHTISGFIIFMVAFIIFIIQNNYSIKDVNPTIIVTYCVLFAIAMTAVWEMWEFAGDRILGLNSQGGSLLDTMKDIITGSIGPVIMFPFLYRYLKGKRNMLFEDLEKVAQRKLN